MPFTAHETDGVALEVNTFTEVEVVFGESFGNKVSRRHPRPWPPSTPLKPDLLLL